LEINLPDVNSFKGKRRVLKGIKDRFKNKFNVSVAELEYHEKRQRTVIGVCVILNSQKHAYSILERVEGEVEVFKGVSLLDSRKEFL